MTHKEESRMNKTPDSTMPDLRSPRMRRLLDRIPGHLAAWLVLLSLLMAGAIALVAALVPYPYSGGESILQHVL